MSTVRAARLHAVSIPEQPMCSFKSPAFWNGHSETDMRISPVAEHVCGVM
jgi:hypothetical protein